MSPTLLVFPAYDDNPYLGILYGRVHVDGWKVRSVVPLPEFLREAAQLGRGDAIHLHWTAQVTQSARTPWGASRNLRRMLAAVDAARERGVRVIWTIHNAISHDARNATQDARLQRALAARADAAHIMNPATAELVDFSLPADRIHRIPHPSYRGAYPEPPTRTAARERLGVAPDSLAVLMLGHMKPYKGVLDLVAAVRGLERPVTLMLAGGGDWRAIDAAAAGLALIAHRDYVPTEEIPIWFAAADVTVLPYRRVLNSGSAMLAATFGVPVVMPDEASVLADYGDQEWVVAFDRTQPVDGIRAVLEDASIDWAAKGERAGEFAAAVPPDAVADGFRELLRQVVR